MGLPGMTVRGQVRWRPPWHALALLVALLAALPTVTYLSPAHAQEEPPAPFVDTLEAPRPAAEARQAEPEVKSKASEVKPSGSAVANVQVTLNVPTALRSSAPFRPAPR